MSSRRVAIVTGASRGIGRAIALQLAAQNCALVVNYVHSRDAAEEVVQTISEQGGEAVAVQADVGRLEDHGRLIDVALRQWNRIDILVNNAGITSPGRRDMLETTPENWDQVLATNLRGPFFLTQQVVRRMLSIRGAEDTDSPSARRYLINISSISAYTASTNRPDYCIAKSGISMMTSLWASRLAEDGIQVFEICPGIIASDMTASVQEKYDRLIADGLTPIRRWGTPNDVARAVAAIVSGLLPYSTGERINVDGGFHLQRL